MLGDPIMSGMHIELKPSAQRGRQRRADAWRAIAVCGFLVLAILLVFGRTLSQGFLNLDDPSTSTASRTSRVAFRGRGLPGLSPAGRWAIGARYRCFPTCSTASSTA